MSRTLVWFSCGAPSAVAAKLLVSAGEPVELLYTYVVEEHPDNERFRGDCEKWIGQPIKVLINEEYHGSIYEVFEKRGYLVGIAGAPCTTLLKRKLREEYQRPGDIHVLGFTWEEQDRLEDFLESFPDMKVRCPLIEERLSKSDCLSMVKDANIKLPAMYLLGYNNNNCRGCVKGGAGYWNKIRIDFPEYFTKMGRVERKLNHSILRLGGNPVFLDELPPDAGRDVPEPKIECSMMCYVAKQGYGG